MPPTKYWEEFPLLYLEGVAGDHIFIERISLSCLPFRSFFLDQLCLLPSIYPEDNQKSIDIESACELLDLVLGLQFRPQVDKLVEYLKVDISYCAVILLFSFV